MKKTADKKEHWNENFYAQDLRGKDFTGHYFYRCMLRATIMDETTILRATAFENCNLSFIDGRKSNWEKSIRSYCDMTYSDLSESNQRFSRIYWSDAKSIKLDGADATGIETDHSRFQYARLRDTVLSGWSREIIGEIIRQGSSSLRVKQLAAWIVQETQLCWEQFLLLKDLPDIAEACREAIPILKEAGFGHLIDNGGRLCQIQSPPQPSSAESEQPQV